MRLITHSWQVNNWPLAVQEDAGVGGVRAALQQNQLLCDRMAVTIATTIVVWWPDAVRVDKREQVVNSTKVVCTGVCTYISQGCLSLSICSVLELFKAK